MRRLLVNDHLTTIPGTRTLWNYLMDWFDMEFVGGDYADLAGIASEKSVGADLIIRNGTYFDPIKTDVPTISLIQDILEDCPLRKMQIEVINSSIGVVFNSKFTMDKYKGVWEPRIRIAPSIIPLPVDFDEFEILNRMGLQQELSLPSGCVCWIGACREAGPVKGWDTFLSIVRLNPDISFVAVFKDDPPEYAPLNMKIFSKVRHEELVKIIGACSVGLCTSRIESQHLAGIEMGACGLPMVAPPVGTYHGREGIPGTLLEDDAGVSDYTAAIRKIRDGGLDPSGVREYWRSEFDMGVIRHQWKSLIEEIEC